MQSLGRNVSRKRVKAKAGKAKPGAAKPATVASTKASLAAAAKVSPAMYRDLYVTMCRIRECEDQLNTVFAKNLFPGYIHSYLGQEACATGVCAALRADDYIVSTHRGRGHYIAKRMPLVPMMAEMFGKATGIGGGRGGEMHAADPAFGILGGNGIVGGGISLAVGAAYAAVLDGNDRVAVTFFGEGASNEGSFHESINIAAAWKLPVLFICENNLYAEMTPFRTTANQLDIAKRAAGYGIPGEVVDGNDVLAVYRAASAAVARARAGHGPSLLELKTYRWGGHFQGDPCKYRTREEEAEWKARDPIPLFRSVILKSGALGKSELDAIEAAAAKETKEAIDFSLASPDPVPETALEKVYAQ
jgi:TPP-dependent pyruvate/acetoin dehydrogenase alpha subunit